MVLSSQKPSMLGFVSAIAIAIAFFIAMAVLWSLHAEPPSLLSISATHQWQQPSVISDRFPEHISTNYWQFDYEATEQSLLKIKQTENGELILNESTAKVLEKAVSTLPPQMKQIELRRIELLITKGFPGEAGLLLSTIFTDFYYYQQALNRSIAAANTPPDIHDKERTFKLRVLLQEEYLGETITEYFFGRQNSLNHYLYARKAINENSSLNPAQKQQQLTILQDRFKTHEE